MDIKNITEKKLNKKSLSKDEIFFAINNYVSENISDAQMTALISAIYCNGLKDEELLNLTDAMLHSGEILSLSNINEPIVDKHSTGGVSDTTTLALVPICASLGVKIFKMSGRGLGHTGGTADKLEAFHGYNPDIPLKDAINLLHKNNGCIITSSKNLAPADKKIYALRDNTGTVASIPLIVSSIMSKKLAMGTNIIVIDVKYGNGAFMPNKTLAKKLANKISWIGKQYNKKVVCVLSKMNQPLGNCIGNSLEANEAIQVLCGVKSELSKETINLASICVSLAKKISKKDAKKQINEVISNKKALEKFKNIIASQGGELSLFERFPYSPTLSIFSNQNGKLKYIDTKKLGQIVGEMGATRQRIDDAIDYNVGIEMFVRLNSKIKIGNKLFSIYAKSESQANKVKDEILNCLLIK